MITIKLPYNSTKEMQDYLYSLRKQYSSVVRYSSIIGNVQYNYIDSVNASIEIARRGYEVIILKNKKFYPDYNLKNSFLHQWKETGLEMIKDWKQFFSFLKKNFKIKYRVPLNENFSVLQFFTVKSNVNLIQKNILMLRS